MRSLNSVVYSHHMVLAAILCGVLASGTWAQAKYEPAPREVLDEFILAAKQTPEYQWYNAFPADRLKEQVAVKWEEELGWPMAADTVTYWRVMQQMQMQNLLELGGGGTGVLRWVNVNGRNTLALEITRYRMGSGASGPQRTSETYLVREADLGDLDREVLVQVRVLEGIAKPVERFAAQNEPLSTLFTRLCAMADANCSYRQDLADKMRITLDARGKTVGGCLTVLARTAGGQVLFVGEGYREPTLVEKVDANHRISLEDLRKQQAESSATQPSTSQPDPVEILRKTVQLKVEELRKNRPVLILQLPAAGE